MESTTQVIRPNAANVGIPGSAVVVYDDLLTSAFSLRNGDTAPSARTYAFGIGGGVAFPVLGFKVDDYVFFQVQTSHSMKLNTPLDLHFHYILPNTTNIGNKIKFRADVVAAPVNGTMAIPAGSPYSLEFAVAADDNTKPRIAELADIAAVNTTVSTIYYIKLTRVAASANDYAGEVYVITADCHYQKDTLGSLQEGSKV